MQDEEHKRKSQSISTDASPSKIRKIPQPNGRFINAMISQWMKTTGANTSLSPGPSIRESAVTPELQMKYKEEMHKNEVLQKKYQNAEERITSLSKSLDAELNIRDEILEKLAATWESIDTITKYCNYISDSLIAFQQHRANLSKLYESVITGQSSALANLQSQLSDATNKYTEQEKMVAGTLGKLTVYENRLQEFSMDNNGLRKQLQGYEEKFVAEKNYLMNVHTEEKLKLIKEQEVMMTEREGLKLRLEKQGEEKRKIVEILNEKESCALKFQNDIVLYKNQIDVLLSAKNELSSKYESLVEDKTKLSAQLELTLRETEQLRLYVNAGKTREDKLTEHLDAVEKKLTVEGAQCAKLRENLIEMENKLRNEKVRNKELENMIESGKNDDNATTKELHKKIGSLHREKDGLLLEKQTILCDMENLKIVWEEKHNNELSTLKRDFEGNIAGMQKTIAQLKKDIWILNTQSEEIRKEAGTLKDNFFEAKRNNEDLENKLKTISDELKKKTASENYWRDTCNKYQSELRLMNQMYKDAQEKLHKQPDVARNRQENSLDRILTPAADGYKTKDNATPLKPIFKSPMKLQFNLSSTPEDDLFDDMTILNSEERFDQLLTQINITQADTNSSLPLNEVGMTSTQLERKFFKSPIRGLKVKKEAKKEPKKEPKKKAGVRK